LAYNYLIGAFVRLKISTSLLLALIFLVFVFGIPLGLAFIYHPKAGEDYMEIISQWGNWLAGTTIGILAFQLLLSEKDKKSRTTPQLIISDIKWTKFKSMTELPNKLMFAEASLGEMPNAGLFETSKDEDNYRRMLAHLIVQRKWDGNLAAKEKKPSRSPEIAEIILHNAQPENAGAISDFKLRIGFTYWAPNQSFPLAYYEFWTPNYGINIGPNETKSIYIRCGPVKDAEAITIDLLNSKCLNPQRTLIEGKRSGYKRFFTKLFL
jgi:hypothetical protein